MEKTIEKHAHICVICQKSFMNESDYFSICPECTKEHKIEAFFFEGLHDFHNKQFAQTKRLLDQGKRGITEKILKLEELMGQMDKLHRNTWFSTMVLAFFLTMNVVALFVDVFPGKDLIETLIYATGCVILCFIMMSTYRMVKQRNKETPEVPGCD